MLGYANPEQLIGKSMVKEITVNLDDREVLRAKLLAQGFARDQPSIEKSPTHLHHSANSDRPAQATIATRKTSSSASSSGRNRRDILSTVNKASASL